MLLYLPKKEILTNLIKHNISTVITDFETENEGGRVIFDQAAYLVKVAIDLDVAPSTFSRLIKGVSDLSPEMALKLSKAFGRTPESWMQMQTNYELWKARQRVNLDRVHIIYEHSHAN